jgi:hypothetical protein
LLRFIQLGQSRTIILRVQAVKVFFVGRCSTPGLRCRAKLFWGSRLRGADVDFLSLDLQLRDSQEAFDSFELKTRHVDCEAKGREAAGAFSP